MERKSRCQADRRNSESGMTLIETAIALMILFITTAGLMSLGVVATMTTENQGHLAARTTEYAQDKMEQLLSLPYRNGDSCTPLPGCGADTTVLPTARNGGYGLAVGGSSDPSAPVDGYVDYLDASGNPLGGGAVPPANWYYMRAWEITSPAANLKQITVTSKVRFGVGAVMEGALAQSTLTTLKTNPF